MSLDGPITDAGDADAVQENAINVSGNTGGSTAITHATKVLNTGEDHAIVMGTSDGHTLTISGGSLDIDTTTGKGLEATMSGTLSVTGASNTIDTGSGRALNVSDTDIGDSDLTFQRIASNGALNGISLNNTGNVNGALVVAGNGGSCTSAATCTGGGIQNSTGYRHLVDQRAGRGEPDSHVRRRQRRRRHRRLQRRLGSPSTTRR